MEWRIDSQHSSLTEQEGWPWLWVGSRLGCSMGGWGGVPFYSTGCFSFLTAWRPGPREGIPTEPGTCVCACHFL